MSSEAEMMMDELTGDVARSLTALKTMSPCDGKPSYQGGRLTPPWPVKFLITSSQSKNKSERSRIAPTLKSLPFTTSYILTIASAPPMQIKGLPVMGSFAHVQQQAEASGYMEVR